MDTEEQKLWEYVEAYLRDCAPIHWLSWTGRCQDEDARKRVQLVLFCDGGLRDLTDAAVKREVLDTIRQEPAIMQLVIADLAEEVAKYENSDTAA